MKFQLNERVRVIAWAVPGTTSLKNYCGKTGTVDKIRTDDNEGADGGYRVTMADGTRWWFRACDLVVEDSPCTCDNTVRHMPVSVCPVHEREDYDPVSDMQDKLTSMINDLEHTDPAPSIQRDETEYKKRAREGYSPHE